jgi:putative membrane protein
MVASSIIRGIRYDTVAALIGASLLLGILNAFVRPFLLILSAPVILLTLGLFILVLNGLLLLLVPSVVAGFHVDGFWSAFWGAIVISFVSWVLSAFFRGSTTRHAASEVESLRTRSASETRFDGLIEIFGESGTELCARAKEYAFYSRHREIEDLGDLFVAELFIPAQHERHPLSFGEPLNRFLDRLLEFRLQKRCVRREVHFILQRRILRAGL